MSLTYEHLARLSIFVEVARRQELNASCDTHRHHFARLFRRLETDPVGGLYTVICQLSTVYFPMVRCRCNVPILGRYRVLDIRRIRVPSTRNDAQRHIRDFTVARTLLEVAERLVTDSRQIAELAD